MTIETNIFKNSAADAIKVTPEEWAYEIEQYAIEQNYMRRLRESIIVYNRIGSVGNSLTVTKNVELATGLLTDGVATSVQALSFNQIEITAAEHGGAIQFTKKQLRDQLPTVRQDVISSLGKALATEEEGVIITEAMTATTSVYPKLSGGTVATSSTITSDETFDLETFNRSLVTMRVKNRTPMYFIVHPKVEGDLRILDDFRDASITGSSYTRETGYIGQYFGVNVFRSTNINTDTEGASDDLTVYKNILLGERAIAIMDKTNAMLEIDGERAVERALTFHLVKDYGVQILNDESIAVVTTA